MSKWNITSDRTMGKQKNTCCLLSFQSQVYRFVSSLVSLVQSKLIAPTSMYRPYFNLNYRLQTKVTFESRTLDVPYGDHFYMKENLFVLAPSENSVKVIMRSENCCVFVKSTIFKSKILSRSIEDIKAYFNHWLQAIETRGFLDPELHSEQRQKRIEEELRSVRETGVVVQRRVVPIPQVEEVLKEEVKQEEIKGEVNGPEKAENIIEMVNPSAENKPI